MIVSSHNPDRARTADRLSLTTPAGLQANANLIRRRLGVLVVNLGLWAGLGVWFAGILSAGGWSVSDAVLLICFLLGTPWAVLGFWNAVIGLWLRHCARDPIAEAAPFLTDAIPARGSIAVETAVLMTVRNEHPERALQRLRTLKASLDATGEGAHFAYFILSDTQIADLAASRQPMRESVVAAFFYFFCRHLNRQPAGFCEHSLTAAFDFDEKPTSRNCL